MKDLAQTRERVAHVNQLIEVIATHGRRFFYCQMKERTAKVWLSADDQVMWQDDYTGQSFALPKGEFKKDPKGFSHGGTLRALVESLGHYIHTGRTLHPGRMSADMGQGLDLWGYGAEAVVALRQAAYALPMFQPAPAQAAGDGVSAQPNGKARRAP